MDRSRTKLDGQISRKERINYIIYVWLTLKRMNTFSSTCIAIDTLETKTHKLIK